MWVNGNLAGGAPAAKRSPTPRKTKNPQAEEQQSGESSRWGEKKPQRKPTREGKRRETREQNRKHREEQEARREGRAVHWGDETKTKHTGVKKTRSKAATTTQQTNTAATKHPQRDGPRRIKSAGDGPPGNTGEGRPLHQNTKRQRNGSDQTQAACSPSRTARSRRSAVPGTALSFGRTTRLTRTLATRYIQAHKLKQPTCRTGRHVTSRTNTHRVGFPRHEARVGDSNSSRQRSASSEFRKRNTKGPDLIALRGVAVLSCLQRSR